MKSRLKIFYSALFFSTLLPYLPFVLPFFPEQIFGFNLTGWAWMIMLLVVFAALFTTRRLNFPVFLWLPWVVYLLIYLILDFSALGLQLTAQYILPLLVGLVAGGFVYSEDDLLWIFKGFRRLCGVIFLMFLYGYLLKGGYGPAIAATTMLFSIAVSLVKALYFITKETKYLLYAVLIILFSILEVTRMGIAATAVVFIAHFSNRSVYSKIIYGTLGLIAFFLIFNTRAFQEKTFRSGSGTISDLTLDYYNNPVVNSSGRITWKKALEPGLRKYPVWGNGPRADNLYLSRITGKRGGEAHNDYLSVRFNYGYVGLVLLLFGFAGSFYSLFRIFSRYRESYYINLVASSALSLYPAFLMFMYSDNILKYTIYFPNYFFALIGIAYSLRRNEDISSYTTIQQAEDNW